MTIYHGHQIIGNGKVNNIKSDLETKQKVEVERAFIIKISYQDSPFNDTRARFCIEGSSWEQAKAVLLKLERVTGSDPRISEQTTSRHLKPENLRKLMNDI